MYNIIFFSAVFYLSQNVIIFLSSLMNSSTCNLHMQDGASAFSCVDRNVSSNFTHASNKTLFYILSALIPSFVKTNSINLLCISNSNHHNQLFILSFLIILCTRPYSQKVQPILYKNITLICHI